MNGASLSDLRSTLIPRGDGRLALTPDLLASSRLSDDWRMLLGTDTLLLADAAMREDTAGNLIVSGRAELLRIADLPVVVTFFVSHDPTGGEEDALECLIVPSAFPPIWQLDTLYPEMPGYFDHAPALIGLGRQPSFLRGLVLRKTTPLYSSFDFSAEDGLAPAPLHVSLAEAPRLDGRALTAGVNLTCEVDCAGPAWTELRDLLAPVGGFDRLDARGTIVSGDNGPVLRLVHSLLDAATGRGPGLALAGAAALSLELREVRLTSGLDAWGESPGLGLRAAITSGGVALGLDIDLGAGASTATISGRFGATPLTLPQLEQALGLNALAAQLPAPLESFGGLGLTRFSAELSLSPLHLDQIAFALTTERPWTILEAIIAVQPTFAFERLREAGDTQTRLDITGDWLLGGTRFETFVSPSSGQFAAYMAVGETLDAAAVLDRFLPGLAPPALALLDLDLHGNYRDGTAGFELETQGGWSFDLGGAALSIGDITIGGDHDEGGFRGRLRGSLSVAGWLVKVDVELADEVAIEVRLPDVNVTDLLEPFLSHVGIPAELPDFDLQDLDVSIVPATGAFRISGSSDSEIGLFPGFDFRLARFSAAREVAAGTRTTHAQMQWVLHLGPPEAPATIALSAGYTGVEGDPEAVASEWVFEGLLDDQTIPVGHLIDALEHLVGLNYPLPTSGLAISDLAIGFNIGARERYFMIACGLVAGARRYGRLSLVARRTLGDDPAETPPWCHAVTLEADLDIGLSSLPLVGRQLDEVAGMRLQALQMTIASRTMPRDEVARLRMLLPSQAARQPDEDLAEGTNFAVQATLGGDTPRFRVPVALSDTSAPRADAVAASPPTGAALPAPPPAAAIDATRWFPIDKTFGAVEIQRIGLRFTNATLTLLLDSQLDLQALHIGLLGLGLSSPLDTFRPGVSLDGITIDYDGGAVSVSGGLMRTPAGGFEGIARLSAGAFALSAMGGYLTADGRQSLFVFGVLDAPLGGPPCCFIHGVAAGLGFNSALRLPRAETVGDFALVRAAMPGGVPGGSGSDLPGVLRSMGDDIRPKAGAEWLAAGIRFTSFEIVESVALLTMTIEGTPRLNLVGLSRLSVPPMSPHPIAVAEIGLVACIDPAAGLLAVEGQLTRNSWILSHDCRLTGGFAFYTWFSGPHEGDFVLTLGGYHPHFPVPAHYPQVPCIAMQWRLSANLQIKGTSYFALVPGLIMAGASMEAVFEVGDLRAWFCVRYDVLIAWKPFHYEIEVAISVGASLRINLLFTSFTLSVHVGADLSLHGPPFGGEAYVDISVISFTIPFGESRPDRKPISWTEFKRSFLPPPASRPLAALASPERDPSPPIVATDSICTIQVSGGLIRDLTTQPGYRGPLQWLANPERFAVSTSSLIPSKAATLNGVAQSGPWRQDFGVAPADVGAAGLDSTHHVRFEKHNAATGRFDGVGGLVVSPVLRNVPAALWRGGRESGLGGPAVVEDTLAGFLITPQPISPDATCAVEVGKLLFENNPIKHFAWSSPVAPRPAAVQRSQDGQALALTGPSGAALGNRDFVLASLLDPATAARRAGVAAALLRRQGRVDPGIDLTAMARTTLADWPSICGLGGAAA